MAIRTGDIAPRPATTPPTWTIDWDRPTQTDAAINEFAAVGHLKEGCPSPGLHGVPLTVFGDDQTSSTLTLSLVKVAEAALDVPSIVTLAATHWWLGRPDPVGFTIRQPIVGAPDVHLTVAGGQMRTASGDPTGVSLEPVDTALLVKPGQGARIMLAPSGPLPPGTYTAQVVLQGGTLERAVTVDVGYRLRLSALILLLMIAIGALLGGLLNHRLSRRAALDAALMDGMRAMQALMRRANPQRDPAVQQRLLAVANLLQSNLEDAKTPGEAVAHVAEAEVQAKEIEGRPPRPPSGCSRRWPAPARPCAPAGGRRTRWWRPAWVACSGNSSCCSAPRSPATWKAPPCGCRISRAICRAG